MDRRKLVQKGKKGILRVIFSRTGLVSVLLLVQIGLLLTFLFFLTEWLPHILGASTALTVGMVLYLLNSRMDSSSKLTWMVVIAAMPVFGSLFYLYTTSNTGQRALRQVIQHREEQSRQQLTQDPEVLAALADRDPGAASLSRYVRSCGCFPVFSGTDVRYFPLGEEMYRQLLEELEKAEKFIFLEFFILDEGEMWDSILEILTRKAKQGVDVRLMYDGTCEFYLLPRNYPEKMEALGIRCRSFAPVQPFVSTHYNFRDHRKILVIDGKTAFTGGINLADEYINRVQKFGHWKDTGIMLQGPAVQSFCLMFLQLWGGDPHMPEYHKFLSAPARSLEVPGFVMPYADSPMDERLLGRQVYMDILNRAQKYVHIMTPYLILDDSMENAICYAARRGVDVKIILPGIPDKQVAYALAKTHFAKLTEAGVKLYTYRPGFVHAKSFVCDDREAVVGTINLDYRSLYHHFECAAWMQGVSAIGDIERDFRKTMEKCDLVTAETIKNEKWQVKLLGFVLKAIAPLL